MSQTSWHSYPSIYNVGHAALAELFSDPVTIEEKVDGSQFSFGVFSGELRCRSKGQQLVVDDPEGMFIKAVDAVKSVLPQLKNGWTYRAEYLAKPKHNTLAYDRIPKNHLIIFDINPSEEAYLPYDEKQIEAERLGFECVPLLYYGHRPLLDGLRSLLDTVSILGGQKIEGFVIKNYQKFAADKKAVMGKHVSEAFKEVHKTDWRDRNPTQGDIVEIIAQSLRTPARWEKAVQHLREAGKITNSPQDISMLLKEVNVDILKECEQDIKTQLWKYAWGKIGRSVVRGLPEWYKDKLLKQQMESP